MEKNSIAPAFRARRKDIQWILKWWEALMSPGHMGSYKLKVLDQTSFVAWDEIYMKGSRILGLL